MPVSYPNNSLELLLKAVVWVTNRHETAVISNLPDTQYERDNGEHADHS